MPTNPHINEILVISDVNEAPVVATLKKWTPLLVLGAAVVGVYMMNKKSQSAFSGVDDWEDEPFTCERCHKKTEALLMHMDDYNEDTICENCFNDRFAKAMKEKNGEWFENNFNKSDYPANFWKKVGAFQRRK
mgnify:FL=1